MKKLALAKPGCHKVQLLTANNLTQAQLFTTFSHLTKSQLLIANNLTASQLFIAISHKRSFSPHSHILQNLTSSPQTTSHYHNSSLHTIPHKPTMRGSNSMATTFLAFSKSFIVRLPVPGPISSTTSAQWCVAVRWLCVWVSR